MLRLSITIGANSRAKWLWESAHDTRSTESALCVLIAGASGGEWRAEAGGFVEQVAVSVRQNGAKSLGAESEQGCHAPKAARLLVSVGSESRS